MISMLGVLARPRAVILVFLTFYLLYVANVISPVVADLLPARFVTFVGLFIYFAAGVVLYTYREIVPFSTALAALALALLMLALPFGAGPVAAPICLPYLVIFAGLSNLPGRAFVRRDLSYGVYLIHAPVLAGFSILYPSMWPWWIVALVVGLVTLPLSYLSCTFVERPAMATKKTVAKWIGGRLLPLQNTIGRWASARCRAVQISGRLTRSFPALMPGRPPAAQPPCYDRSSGAGR
jgi:peptidoglycan/LPS O-acetylase OafA/YrhL